METLLADLVKAIKSNKPHPDQADLPIFHPETDDANKWLQQVEGIKGELEWSDVDVLSEWSSHLWKIQLVLNTTIQKTIGMTPLQALLGIRASTPLVQSMVQNLTDDVRPIRNINADRELVRKALKENSPNLSAVNTRRRNTARYNVGDVVLMHRDSTMYKSKQEYEFMGPYEIVSVTPEGRFEIRRLGRNAITKAAKEQLRPWPKDWSVALDMDDLLEFLEAESENEQCKSLTSASFSLQMG
jgi:hypothetical protein